MAFDVTIDERAIDQLQNLPKKIGRRLFRRIEALASNPRPAGSEKVVTTTDLRKVRSGDYRIIYAILGREVYVLKVADRKDVYRALGSLQTRLARIAGKRKK